MADQNTEKGSLLLWINATRETILSYRRMIDSCVEQLTDEQLARRPAEGINSVAIIIRHLGGNLRSRWTDFLTTDGEKPDRHRDTEFEDWPGDRQTLLDFFDQGWQALDSALESVNDDNISQQVFIRGEAHSVPQAFSRSVTHISYHVGQIALVARMVHDGDWQWLTVKPGGSVQHNQRTWGKTASRSVFGGEHDEGK